jgi:hypothetical protein
MWYDGADGIQHVDSCEGCGAATFTCRLCGRPSARCAAKVTADPDADADDRSVCVDCNTKLEEAGESVHPHSPLF